MSKLAKYFDPQTLAKLQTLKLRARHVVEGYVAGSHRSPSHGFSTEFSEHREYAPGDDLRYVDWKAFGRTDKLYLKQFEDETNLVCHIALDASESMWYQGPGAALSKWDFAATAAASLAWLILRQQDAVGLTIYDAAIRTHLRASSHAAHLQHLLQAMESSTPRPATSTGRVLHELAERLERRGLVILLSDLLDDAAALTVGLKHLQHRRQEVIVVHILDAAEIDFPFHGPTMFRGLERASSLLTDPRAVRRAYQDQLQKFLRQVQGTILDQGMDYVLVRNDMPLDLVLSSFLVKRLARVL